MSSPGSLETRQFGLAVAIAIVIGESVGLGIFLTPAAMAKSLGSPLLLGAVWAAMALMAMSGALCYSELAIRSPESGGEYVYLRAGYGDRTAFLYGWMSSIVMYPGVAAALSVGAAAYVAQVLSLRPKATALTPAIILCAFGLVNLVGTRLGASLMTVVNVLKLLILFALSGWAALSGHAHIGNLMPLVERRSGSEPLIPAVAGALVAAFFSLGGWWEVGKIAGQLRNPRRTLPIAFVGGVALATLSYLLISASFLAVLPIERLSSNTVFVAQFGEVLFGAAGAKLLSLCVLVCVFGGIAALTMASPRVTYAMARTGTFFPSFGRPHPRLGTPVNSILLQTGLSLAALLLGAFDRILAYIIFSVVCFLALTASTLFRMRDPVRNWWFPAAPIVFIVFCIVIGLLILVHDPLPALIGVITVICGLPLYQLLTARQVETPLTNEGS
ncbi:MAG: amino acid permease [Terracidiphilus sp.]|jgi:APA family basic amino acid/polyamine antiporter